VIVGNKTDLERKLPFEEIEATVCLDWECGYAETSAYTGVGVHQVFIELLKQAQLLAKPGDSLAGLMASKDGSFMEKRPSLVKRLLSRDSAKDLGDCEEAQHKAAGCKIS